MKKHSPPIIPPLSSDDEEYMRKLLVTTDSMPTWMWKTLESFGIKGSFKIKNLTKPQMEIFEILGAITEMQNQGLVEVTYDPKTQEPIFQLTKKAKK